MNSQQATNTINKTNKIGKPTGETEIKNTPTKVPLQSNKADTPDTKRASFSLPTRRSNSIRIASWNIQHFSMKSWEEKKNIDIIINTIISVDFIALQEIVQEEVVEKLITELHRRGNFTAGNRPGKSQDLWASSLQESHCLEMCSDIVGGE